jgi:hypothetical protein
VRPYVREVPSSFLPKVLRSLVVLTRVSGREGWYLNGAWRVAFNRERDRTVYEMAGAT